MTYVIGTAGHVDHGKSSLVRYLTGQEPDRLREEKQRGLTIDLGFAWFDLNGETIGIVDVPGHRDFIENMLSGVGGVDAVLLVVAADEGVMPQTREHLSIIGLLGVQSGLVALTKVDLVDDPDWLRLVELDVREALAGTALATADILPISPKTGRGMAAFVARLAALLTEARPRSDLKQPYLPVDRVFSVSGFGTVVTGTLSGGVLAVGDAVELQPGGAMGRVRGLQSYEQPVARATPGSRVAVNIAGVDRHQAQRGMTLAPPGMVVPTRLLDAHYTHLPDAPRPLSHNDEVKLFVGAAQVLGNVRLLDAAQILPGESGWVQIRLRTAVAVLEGGRYILRWPTPAATIGGGIIVNTHPGRRYKRFQQPVLDELRVRLSGTPLERVLLATNGPEPLSLEDLRQATSLSDADLNHAVEAGITSGDLIEAENGQVWGLPAFERLTLKLADALAAYHTANPYVCGMPIPELVGVMCVSRGVLLWAVGQLPDIELDANQVRLQSHEIRLTAAQEAAAARVLAALEVELFAPPDAEALKQISDADVLAALVSLGCVVRVSPDVIFSRAAYHQMNETVAAMLDAKEEVTVKTLRDRLGSSRKYVLAYLEHLDSIGVTRRIGDKRVRA